MHDDGLFELGPTPTGPESNITNIIGNNTDPGPDWDDIFDADGVFHAGAFGGEGTFLEDGVSGDGRDAPPDDTTYAGAGSDKNGDAIDTWTWGSNNVPAKNDISNAYAYAKRDGSGDQIVYLGAERLAPNGASHMDIELFQDEVALDKEPACGADQSSGTNDGAPCEFVGSHTDDDILVSMDYTNGGAIGEVVIRKWSGTGYVVVAELDGEGCNEADPDHGLAADVICAFNNGSPIDGGDWPNYDNLGAVIETLPTNAFTEFGMNVTALLGGATPCFPTIQVKTRSSPSFTAELKDFAIREFQACTSRTVTTPTGPDGGTLPDGDSDSLPDVVSGGLVADTVTVTVGGTADWSGTVQFYLCDPDDLEDPDPVTAPNPDPQVSCIEGGTAVGSPVAVSDETPTASSPAVTVTEPGKYCWRAYFDSATDGVPDSVDDSVGECFEVIQVPTDLDTRQFVYPQDRASISASAGGNLAGSVTFKLYDNAANCTANGATGLLLTDGPHAIAGASPQIATTNNTTVTVKTDTTVYWRVSYDSTNGAQLDSESACLESTAVDFTNDPDDFTTVPLP